MSEALDKVRETLETLASDAKSPDALRIVDTLSKSLAKAQQDLLYERMPSEPELPDAEIKAFKKQVYDQLHKERATDLFIAYDAAYFAQFKQAVTRLSLVQILIVIAKEQEQAEAIPAYWQSLLDSRGHLV